MDLLSTDCKLASPTSLQLCIKLLGAGVDSNWSVYSASGLDIYIDLGIKLKSTAAAAATREFEVNRHDHLNLAVNSANLPDDDSFPPHKQKLQLQAEESACRIAAASGEEMEEIAQSICEPPRRFDDPQTDNPDDNAVQLQEEEEVEGEKESTAVTDCSNGGLVLEMDASMCVKPLLTCPSHILSQIECFDMADVSAACHLLELSSYSGSSDSSGREQSSTETFDRESSRQHYSDFYETASDNDFEELTQLVDKLQSALPGGVQPIKSWMTRTKLHNMGNAARTFRKRRVRAKLIKQTDVGEIYFDDWDFEVDVLDRPPSKRRNRSVDIIYKRSIQV